MAGARPTARSGRRLAITLVVAAATCVLGLVALVVHTRALAAAHREVAHHFGAFEERQGQLAPVAASLCAPDAVTGEVGNLHAELWGDVVVSGVGAGADAGGHTASSAEACCKACENTRGCNIFVWCADKAACGQQCWLKRVGDPAAATVHNTGAGVPWQSGALPKDGDVAPGSLPPPDESITSIVLASPKGNIRLKLRPEWSESSVAFVRLLAAHPLCTPACEWYRVEPGFLLQGSLRALIPSNNVTTKGPRAMKRGDVGWAGAGPGPDLFIYLGAQPATHWGTDHTVWAEVADEASLAVADKIAALPPQPTKPGEMHIIQDRVKIDKRRFLVLSGTGHRRERKGSPLANSWRQFADALLMPALMVQTGTAARPDLVVVDLSPLREGRARCMQARDECVALSTQFAATLARDDAESASEANDELLDQAIWQLPPVFLEFACTDRPSAKAFAEALCLELCGGPQADTTSSKRRTRESDVEEPDAEDA